MTRILIVEARFYPEISDALYEGAAARARLRGRDGARHRSRRARDSRAPFGWRQGRYDGFVALGCVIRGETHHFEIVANESARGLMDLMVRDGLCIGNGILTVEDEDAGASPRAARRARQGRRRRARLSRADRAQAALRQATKPSSTVRASFDHLERSAARLAALQALYQLEITGNAPDDVIEEFVEHRFGRGAENGSPKHDEAFFSDLVHGVLKHQVEIDRSIAKALAQGWTLARIDSILAGAVACRIL